MIRTLGSFLARMPIGTKLLLPVLLSVAIGVAASTLLVSSRSALTVETLSISTGQELAGRIAAQVDGELSRPLQIARTLRDSYVYSYQSGIRDRGVYLALLRNILAANPDYVGGWTVWDADGFGALVPDPGRKVEGTNPDGSFSPYAVNHARGTTVQVLDDYKKPGPGDYYLLAHATGREQVLEPYRYAIDGKVHLITSVAVPIVVDGKTVGVLGLDTSLDSLSQRIGAIHPYETGAVAILSNRGVVVASRGGVRLGQSPKKFLAGIGARIAAGETFMRTGWSDYIGAEAIEIFVPIKVGETSNPWSVMVALPRAIVLQPAHDISLFVIGTGLLLLMVLAVVVILLVRGVITRPAERIASVVTTLKNDDTNVAVPYTDRSDEFGVIARAIDLFRRNLIEVDLLQRREVEMKAQAEAEKRRTLERLSDQLSRYLSPQVYQSIFQGKTPGRIEGQRKKLTIFFSDIANFTQTTDMIEAEELTTIVNQYLTEMSRIALAYGATIDKFIGDAIMAFFGDPSSEGVETDAITCVRMALAMQTRMETLRQEWQEQGVAYPFHIRIGIDTGYCTVGNFGSEDRMDYTIIGGPVNLSSRLQAHAEGGEVVLSATTYALVKNAIECVDGGMFHAKGLSQPIQTFKALSVKESRPKIMPVFSAKWPGSTVHVDSNILSDPDRRTLIAFLETTIRHLNEPSA